MEAQIASLAAWVHQVHTSPSEPVRRSGPGSSRSLSDIPTAYSLRKSSLTPDMREKMNDMQCRLHELRVELQGLRRMEQLNQETMREAFVDSMVKLKKVMSCVPGADHLVVRHQRLEADAVAEAYIQDKIRVEKELNDLEKSVEELKSDVIARKCRVNVSDVEGLALLLSNITKALADLKVRFPSVHESLRKVMAGEMEIVVREEKFVKEEPRKIEAALKRCKNLTSTLYTLKRLADVQDRRPLQIPHIATESKDVGENEKMAILESIRAMVPDHESRVQSLEVASKALRHPAKGGATLESDDGKNSGEGPSVPAKPARLLTASELKRRKAGRTSLESSDVISPEGSNPSCARTAFFSSMQSATLSSSSISSIHPISVASSMPVTSLPAPSHTRPVAGGYNQGVSPTKSRSAFSSIPLPSKTYMAEKDSGKKVPPPPPPRKSSAKYGSGPLSPSSINGGGSESSGRRNSSSSSGEKSPDGRKKDSGLPVFSPAFSSSTASAGGVVPLSLSTLKQPTSPQKHMPMTKYQKDLAAGIYANLNRPDLQHQKMAPDRLLTSMASPPTAAVITNSQDPPDEMDNMSDSTGSSTSLDSQVGVALLRSPLGYRGPRPEPPQRHSSLGSGKGLQSDEPSSGMDSRQRLSSGSAFTQVNGLRSENGHKT